MREGADGPGWSGYPGGACECAANEAHFRRFGRMIGNVLLIKRTFGACPTNYKPDID